MSGFLDRVLGRSSKGSGTTAKERLQFILVHDRINLPPERLQAMKQEILDVISRYVHIDVENVEVALQQRDKNSLIIAEIPFSQNLDQDEARRRMSEVNKPADPADQSEADDG